MDHTEAGRNESADLHERKMMSYTFKDILKIQVAPALGCTEPVAIALGSAAAASLLADRDIDSVEVWVDPNIYKNGLAVMIPGTQGLSGLETAAALGALGGDPGLRLEVLDPIDDAVVAKAREFVHNNKVKVNLLMDRHGLYIRTVVRKGSEAAESVISGVHDHIVKLALNDVDISDNPLVSTADGNEQGGLAHLEQWLKSLSVDQLVKLIDELDVDDFHFLQQSIDFNLRLAEYGLKHGPGLGVGKTLQRLVTQRMLKKDMIMAARIITSAAADARMAGVKLPAMSSAGSGNHGLTAVLPIWAVKDYIECDTTTLLQAIGLSHLITAYVKAYTGRLSAICGCSVAAGAGATAGLAYVLSGDVHHIVGAVRNLTQDLAGVICDGAKAGCALKLATAAGTAVQAALFSLQGVTVQPMEGIVGPSLEKTTENIGTLSTCGMVETDRTILGIMLERRFHRV